MPRKDSDEEVELLTIGPSGETLVNATSLSHDAEESGVGDGSGSGSSSSISAARRRRAKQSHRPAAPMSTPRLMIAGLATLIVIVVVTWALTVKEPEVWNGVITKSPMDNRDYEYLRLPNSLRVLLVSDPDAEKAAASMAVRVGHLSDPDNVSGLAHFCEHMLFMGSAKYPREDEYNVMLAKHGGHSNAYTSSEETVYYFDVDPSSLAPTLDVFAQFFVSPLFSRSSIDREMKAVDNEHRKNLQNDGWRLNMLQRSLAKSHEMSKFGTGSLETLNATGGGALREEVQRWYRQHYSANLMALVVTGRETLKTLRELVESSFASVPNNDLKEARFGSHPYPASSLPLKVEYIPVQDEHTLTVTWPLDFGESEHFHSKSFAYVSHILGHEAQGSLACALKRFHHWIHSLNTGVGDSSRTYTMFEISMSLTDEGIQHVDEIVQMVCAYINFLRQNPPKEWVWKESKTIAELQFRYLERSDPASYVTRLSSDMLTYPPQYVLSHSFTYTDFEPGLIMRILDEMVVSNMMVLVGSRQFAAIEAQMATEQWYGTKYRLLQLDGATRSAWQNADIASYPPLAMIASNPMLPTNMDLVAHTSLSDQEQPVTLVDEPARHLYFLADQTFLRPTVNIIAQILFDTAPSSSPHAQVCAGIATTMIVDSLTAKVGYYAAVAGMSFSIGPTYAGVEIAVGGYSDKAMTLLHMCLEEWANMQFDSQFGTVKEAMQHDLENSLLSPPYIMARMQTNRVLKRVDYSVQQLLAAVNNVTADSLQDWFGLWHCVGIDALVHGNYDDQTARSVLTLFASQLNCGVSTNVAVPTTALLPTPPGNGFVRLVPHDNAAEINAAIDLHFQSRVQEGVSMETDVQLIMLSRLIAEPCFHTLRTTQQLGYIAQCYLKKGDSAQGISVIIQSGVKTAQELDERARAFMQSIPTEVLRGISDEHFGGMKDALINELTERPKRLGQVTSRVWSEIRTNQFDYHRRANQARVVATTQMRDVIQLAESLFDVRKSLASWSVPQASNKDFQDRTPITDIEAFHSDVQTWLGWFPKS